MPTILVKRLRGGALLPVRSTDGATGWDLHACLEQLGYVDVGPDPVLVPTGLAIEAPPDIDVQVRPRSGLAARGVMAVFGTVDSDYRGELLVTLYRVGADPARTHRVHHGDRIAQIVFAAVVHPDLVEVDRLQQTARGAGGHGSTGL